MTKKLCIISYVIILYIAITIGIRHEGIINPRGDIFKTFLKNYLNLLVDGCSGKQLKNHCRVMYTELADFGYKYTKRLSKIYEDLSYLYTDLIHEEIKSYLKELDRSKNRRTEFLKALDEAFHAKEIILFENYISDLSDYCNKEKLLIREETHKLLHEVILHGIEKLSYKKQRQLRKKLDSALKEYSNIDVMEKLKMYNIPIPTRWHGLG